jgi:hypothetical protein
MEARKDVSKSKVGCGFAARLRFARGGSVAALPRGNSVAALPRGVSVVRFYGKTELLKH